LPMVGVDAPSDAPGILTMLPKRAKLLILTMLLLCGCNPQDNDRLSRMGRAAAVKLERLRGGSQEPLLPGWGKDPGARVSARIRWDKGMEGASVDARIQGGEITLKGTVRDGVQRQRAIDIANATLGAERVVDELTIVVESSPQ